MVQQKPDWEVRHWSTTKWSGQIAGISLFKVFHPFRWPFSTIKWAEQILVANCNFKIYTHVQVKPVQFVSAWNLQKQPGNLKLCHSPPNQTNIFMLNYMKIFLSVYKPATRLGATTAFHKGLFPCLYLGLSVNTCHLLQCHHYPALYTVLSKELQSVLLRMSILLLLFYDCEKQA